MFCNNCGKEAKEGNRFCNNCGSPIDQASAMNNVPNTVPTPVKGKNSLIAVIAIAVLVILGVGIAAFMLGRGSAEPSNSGQIAEGDSNRCW
jgi:uncharacterized membrane protein YvbJ